MKALAASGDLLSQYSSVLEVILRLRQACCATELIPSERLAAAQEIIRELDGAVGGSGDGSGKNGKSKKRKRHKPSIR